MATVAKIKDDAASGKAGIAFNSYRAWEEVREENRVLWDALSRSLILIDSMADRLERRGEDVSTHRNFTRSIRARVLS
jgi:hypothetical protein